MFIQTRIPRQGAASTMFSTLTFNMQNGQLWDDASPDTTPVDLAASAAFIQEQDCDIVFFRKSSAALREAGKSSLRRTTNFFAPGSRIRVGFRISVEKSAGIAFGLGLAIFSKTPLRNFSRIDLPPADIGLSMPGSSAGHRIVS